MQKNIQNMGLRDFNLNAAATYEGHFKLYSESGSKVTHFYH